CEVRLSSFVVRLHDPSTADNFVATVEDRCLAWSDRSLRFVKNDTCPCVGKWMDRRGSRVMTIADFNVGADRFRRLIERDPVDALRDKLRRLKFVRLADDDLILCAFDLNNVQRLLVRDTEATSLTDRVSMNSRMLANRL